MNIFCDSLSGLRYEHGIVSFLLHSSTNKPDVGPAIHVRYEDFAQIVGLLSRELASIDRVHKNWLHQQANASPPLPDRTEPVKAQPIGRKLASI